MLVSVSSGHYQEGMVMSLFNAVVEIVNAIHSCVVSCCVIVKIAIHTCVHVYSTHLIVSTPQATHQLINGADVMVCTPPCLLKLMDRKITDLDSISHLVITVGIRNLLIK